MLKPCGSRILVRRNSQEREIGSLLLPESAQENEGAGIVVACGPRVESIKPNDEIIFASGLEEIQESTYGGIIIHEHDVLCVIESEDNPKVNLVDLPETSLPSPANNLTLE